MRFSIASVFNNLSIWGASSYALSNFGIYECSEILRRYGIHIPKKEKVYAANHYRAIVDMLYQSVKHKNYPYHLGLEDWIDDPKQKAVLIDTITMLKPYLSAEEWQIVEKWLSQQT